jgi:hypothetical protein
MQGFGRTQVRLRLQDRHPSIVPKVMTDLLGHAAADNDDVIKSQSAEQLHVMP